MNKLKPYITILGVFLVPSLGFVLIGWMIFSRLFRVRLPKDVPTEITSYGDVVYFVIFLGALVNCIAIIYSLLKNPNPTPSNNNRLIQWLKQRFTKLGEWLKQKLTKLGEWYYGLYKSAYAVLLRLIVKLDAEAAWGHIIFRIGDYLLNAPNLQRPTQKRILRALVCTEIIPPSIVAIALFIDVYYFGKFHYLYSALSLMIIPLAFKAMLYMVKELSERTVSTLQEHIIFHHSEIINGRSEQFYEIIQPDTEVNLARNTNLDFACREIIAVVNSFDDVRNQFRLYFLSARLLTGLIFLISWSLVIYKLF